MPVKGIREVVDHLNRVPAKVRVLVEEAIEEVAMIVLEDMRALTPIDPAGGGSHARDGLVAIISDDGLQVNVGLPTQQLVNDYFWFRFLDSGTKGGQVQYWRKRKDGSRTRHTMTVPPRVALHIRERALDGNFAQVRSLIATAIQKGLDT